MLDKTEFGLRPEGGLQVETAMHEFAYRRLGGGIGLESRADASVDEAPPTGERLFYFK